MGSRVLVTGGAGFIGSHTCLVLLEAGYDLLILDNFSNSSPEALTRVAAVANVALDSQRLQIQRGDIRDPITLDELFSAAAASGRPFDAVIHFAGLKAVGESVEKPLLYWDVNVSGSRTLLAAMDAHACRTLVFSSSATVYGYPETVPIPESAPVQPINPYGFSKAAVEQMLADLNASAPNTWRIASLRYFNPVGAHPSGQIGEDPLGIPNNLFPFISQVAVGRREELKIFGSDWPTHDGTGVRDFIHVMDLAEGHEAALKTLLSQGPQHLTCNLGSGEGASVLDVVNTFSATSGRNIPLRPRRPATWRCRHHRGRSHTRRPHAPLAYETHAHRHLPRWLGLAAGQSHGLPTIRMTTGGALLLAGGGHSHSLLLKRWAMQPERRPPQSITLVNRCSTALYSGMVPGLIAGLYQRDELAIDLRQLCDRAGVAFVEAEITGLILSKTFCTFATALHSTSIGSAWMWER